MEFEGCVLSSKSLDFVDLDDDTDPRFLVIRLQFMHVLWAFSYNVVISVDLQ